MNFCPKCRKKLVVPDFCVECGADLSEYLNPSDSASSPSGSLSSFDFSHLAAEAEAQLAEKERLKDFEIENGVLKKYKGNGGRVIVPGSIKIIGEKAFENVETVTDVILEEGVEQIEVGAFWRASALRTVSLPLTLKSMDRGAFGMTGLEYVAIPHGVRELPARAFDYCKQLKRIDLPDTLEKIGEEALARTRKLMTIFIPRSVKTIERSAFHDSGVGCICFEADNLPEGAATVSDKNSRDNWDFYCFASKCFSMRREDTVIPDYDEEAKKYGSDLEHYDTNDFEAFNSRAVYCQREMDEVRFPFGVVEVGLSAMNKCKNPTSIQFPATTQVIGSCFMGGYGNKNESLISVYAERVSTIENDAFSHCKALREFCTSETIESIGYSAFEGCSSLSSFKLPPHVKKIGGHAFQGVPAFKDLKLPNTLKEMGSSAFSECPNLERVEIGTGLKVLGQFSFLDCKKLLTVRIPSTIKKIGMGAFSGCNRLTDVELPEGIEELEAIAFQDCTSLKTVKIPYSMTTMETETYRKSFEGCTGLRFVYVPRGRKEAFRGAFPSSYANPNLTIMEY